MARTSTDELIQAYRADWRSCEIGHAEIAHPVWRQCPMCELLAKCRAIESVLKELRADGAKKEKEAHA